MAAANNANEDKGLDVGPPKDDDSDGMKLVQAADRLERAAKFLRPLTTLAANNVDIWLTSYDVSVRRSKTMLLTRPLPC
jgi:N-alpha-acetyltransferase 15/16, NatA auxiliary subunit